MKFTNKITKKWVATISCAVFLLLVVAGVVALSGPSEGSIIKGSADSTDSFTPTAAPVNLTNVITSYATYSYPSAMKQVTGDAAQAPILYTSLYRLRETFTWQLGVTVMRLNRPSLDSDASLQFRRSQPENYTETSQHIGTTDFVIMASKASGGNDKVAYSLNGYRVGEIAITGYRSTQNGQSQDQLFRAVLESWKWAE